MCGGITNQDWPGGCGTVFKVNTDGSGYTVLKKFNGNDGAYPAAGLVLSGTTLYGTTDYTPYVARYSRSIPMGAAIL